MDREDLDREDLDRELLRLDREDLDRELLFLRLRDELRRELRRPERDPLRLRLRDLFFCRAHRDALQESEKAKRKKVSPRCMRKLSIRVTKPVFFFENGKL